MIRFQSTEPYLLPRPGRRGFRLHVAVCSVCGWRSAELPSETDTRRVAIAHACPEETHP